MARIRTIKPTHVNDKELANITLQAHLLWVLSWCYSDDEGVFENDPLLLKSQLFPRRTDIRVTDITQWLDQLDKARYIIPFDHQGQGYYIHRTFKAHQKIDRPQPSKIPSEIIQRALDDHSSNDRPCIGEYSNGKESKVIRPKGLVVVTDDARKQKELKAQYDAMLEALADKDKIEVWNAMKQFISEKKPAFIEPYMDAWNLFAISIRLIEQPSKITEKRKKKFAVRIHEAGFDFLKILECIKKSSFLKGQSNNNDWKVSFEFIIDSEENYTKILEGKYQ